ncbi:YqiA/YcfP family alpha/beta fold hydrolase [Herbaspirillum sp. RTI4]|uniref:YqiA/YcfP family alpha/beta fold hydrolase n=1 Tax=Herbaspirillum sp. RTI4 TaxID=3048640 RepID=UPI002AB5D4EC|nr:YqiA/YcfP family alpha/beta fold hydrolase [Herbaspirillum sp. RTI4]MDY7577533.1 YqiA/YcfP family alpha/beta fold hydrolase [Herbaspirillum sp. RTI4]MEA9981008.1 YqiA/YcfP family alpha/beta fold hydrolase [Herbaspirillum sp. RTI4]
MILYLHGFRSSPQSFKARWMGQRLQELGRADEYRCPQLPASPKQAIALALGIAETFLQTHPVAQLSLIGSSLGGYYATWLAERLGCRAVLLNPAVKPPRDLQSYVGISTQYHSDEPFEFRPEYVAELEALAIAAISAPQRYFLLAATGDEVLDWRESRAFYLGAKQCIIAGSDHGLSDFTQYADEVLSFCDSKPGAATPSSATGA